MASRIERRKFLATLSGAAAWPLAAHAQQPAMPVIGFIYSASPDPIAHRLRAFRQCRWPGRRGTRSSNDEPARCFALGRPP
jgi:hypothetical protein